MILYKRCGSRRTSNLSRANYFQQREEEKLIQKCTFAYIFRHNPPCGEYEFDGIAPRDCERVFLGASDRLIS